MDSNNYTQYKTRKDQLYREYIEHVNKKVGELKYYSESSWRKSTLTSLIPMLTEDGYQEQSAFCDLSVTAMYFIKLYILVFVIHAPKLQYRNFSESSICLEVRFTQILFL